MAGSTSCTAECEELRANYYALMAFCDHLLGQLLDYFDQHDLWKDTALRRSPPTTASCWASTTSGPRTA